MRILRLIPAVVVCLAGISQETAFSEEASVDYLTQVKPLLKARCYACHGALKQEGGLRLDTAALILKGGDSGAVISPGESVDESVLLERVSSTEPGIRMPPEHEGELFKADEIALLKKWIAAGAKASEDEVPEADPKDHWSFQSVERPEPPAVGNAAWVRNPIDAWIAAGHEQQGLVPQPEASRIVLLRRLSMDLIGLPPTAEEIAAFEADSSADWYEKAVERLLDDPRHGERWARHWMDVWRYSDWWGLGAQLRNSQRHMWHWRDWIVESLNEDQPYDEMVRLMLAADELAPGDPKKLRATGFLARNYYIFNRTQWLDETVEHVSKGLLGLTMNCSKCHDHKFDPIPQEDYYRLRAVFEPYQVRLDMVPGEMDLERNGIPRAFDGLIDAPTYVFVRGNDAQPDKSKVIEPGIPSLFAFEELNVEPIALPRSAWQPGVRPWVLDNHIAAAKKRLQDAEAKRSKAEQELKLAESQELTNSPQAEFAPIVETFETLDATRWKLKGDGWKHEPGKLEQTQDGNADSHATLLTPVPQDFEAVLRFQLLGGSTWRSVGINFDIDEPEGSAGVSQQTVYLSGATGGSKIQGSFTQAGKPQYPAEGRKAMPVEVGKEYTLQVRARGNLINVSVNGKHVLSWRTPIARRAGSMQFMTFDALAVIQEFRVSALDRSVAMLQPDASVAPDPGELFQLAEADLAVARANLKSVELRAAAFLAQKDQSSPAAQQESRLAAIRAERELAVETARRGLMAAEQTLRIAVDDKRADAEKKLAAAKEALAKADTALAAEILPTDKLTPFMGAQWTPTRFQHTGRDDPDVPFPATSTGRRAAFAKWVTDKRNPLTARVAVNHLWNRHFGTPLAPALFDLGRNGPVPTHPELIDWLASEFMESGWNMKHLHRLIVTSATYRMSSSVAGAEANLAKDPDNRFWWRRVPVRIESQAVRDSILSLAGTLDPVIGGPSVPADQQAASKRRSLYFHHSNNDRNMFLTTFDEAEVGECYRREQSIVPQQALALTNSGLVLDSSRQIADRIAAGSADDNEFVKRAFTLLLGMPADDEELAASLEALESWKKLPDGSAELARTNLIWVLLNHNDFVTLR